MLVVEGILANQRYRSGRGDGGFSKPFGNLSCQQWPFSVLVVGHVRHISACVSLLYVLDVYLSMGSCHGLSSCRPLTTESQVLSHTINMGFMVNNITMGGPCL